MVKENRKEIRGAKTIEELNKYLSVLWEQRKTREESFGDLVNMLQIYLAATKPEEVNTHIRLLWEVTEEAFSRKYISGADCNECIIKLTRGGLDMWKGLS